VSLISEFTAIAESAKATTHTHTQNILNNKQFYFIGFLAHISGLCYGMSLAIRLVDMQYVWLFVWCTVRGLKITSLAT
jgi:hypothetical protein